MTPEPTVELLDQRRLTIPNGGLDNVATGQVASFIKRAADDGYVLASVAARQKDYGSQRDPDIRTEAIILNFQRSA